MTQSKDEICNEMRDIQDKVLKIFEKYPSTSRIFEDYNITLKDIRYFIFPEHKHRFLDIINTYENGDKYI